MAVDVTAVLADLSDLKIPALGGLCLPSLGTAAVFPTAGGSALPCRCPWSSLPLGLAAVSARGEHGGGTGLCSHRCSSRDEGSKAKQDGHVM